MQFEAVSVPLVDFCFLAANLFDGQATPNFTSLPPMGLIGLGALLNPGRLKAT
jgi:hypothetical protein